MTATREAGIRRLLPTIVLDGKGYFVDLDGRLFRQTMDPGRHIDFDSVKGKQLREQAGIVTCLRCGASVIVAVSLRQGSLRCVRCGVVAGGSKCPSADLHRQKVT